MVIFNDIEDANTCKIPIFVSDYIIVFVVACNAMDIIDCIEIFVVEYDGINIIDCIGIFVADCIVVFVVEYDRINIRLYRNMMD